MGQSASSGRRNDYRQQNPSFSYSSPPPNQSAPLPPASSHLLPPPPPSHPPPPSPQPPRSYYSTPYPMPSPPNPNPSYYHQSSPWMCRPAYPQYYGPSRTGSWWTPPTPPAAAHPSAMVTQPPARPPAYVEQAKTVKNDVNVHKDSIRLVPDEQNPDHHLVSFTFDAMVDGSVTIYYFAKEGAKGDLSPLYADIYTPKRIPFLKGLGQKFVQPSGSGIDLGFFDLNELSQPLQGDVFPLVVYAESPRPSPSIDEKVIQSSSSAHAQITQAVIEKNNDGNFQVKVVKQILWVDGERYELQEIFGLVSSVETEVSGGDDADIGKECVICLSELRDTAVLPCRHMCMCSECAKALRLQSNKCPICRQPVEQLMEIKVNNADP